MRTKNLPSLEIENATKIFIAEKAEKFLFFTCKTCDNIITEYSLDFPKPGTLTKCPDCESEDILWGVTKEVLGDLEVSTIKNILFNNLKKEFPEFKTTSYNRDENYEVIPVGEFTKSFFIDDIKVIISFKIVIKFEYDDVAIYDYIITFDFIINSENKYKTKSSKDALIFLVKEQAREVVKEQRKKLEYIFNDNCKLTLQKV